MIVFAQPPRKFRPTVRQPLVCGIIVTAKPVSKMDRFSYPIRREENHDPEHVDPTQLNVWKIWMAERLRR